MGDISAEPSMEEILSSIKRIIREEGDAGAPPRGRRPSRPLPQPIDDEDIEEVLELSDPVAEVPAPIPVAAPAPEPVEEMPPVSRRADPILSEKVLEASRGKLEALSRMVVKPEVAGSDTLEGMVRDMIKPMLSEWLDANLPRIVETMVAREIERITERR